MKKHRHHNRNGLQQIKSGNVERSTRVIAKRLGVGYGREHTLDKSCWCKPSLEFVSENGNDVYVHNDPRGGVPPPELICEAIAEAAFDE